MPWVDREPVAPRSDIQLNNIRPLEDGVIPMNPRAAPWMGEVKEKYAETLPSSKEPTDAFEMHVFISRGIPEGALRQMFKQAKDFPPGAIRFVVRGFEPQKIGELASH